MNQTAFPEGWRCRFSARIAVSDAIALLKCLTFDIFDHDSAIPLCPFFLLPFVPIALPPKMLNDMSIAETASAAELLRQVTERVAFSTDFIAAVASLRKLEPVTFDGVWGSSSALVAAALARHEPPALVIVSPEVDALDGVCNALELFSSVRPLRLPAWESEPGERIIHDEIFGERLRTLKRLLEPPESDDPRVLVTSLQSLLQPVPSRGALADGSRQLRVGDTLEVDVFLKWLLQQRFHHSSAVELPGEFSHRGGILDLFSPDWEQPVRMELYGDEIESIRRFEVNSQRSLGAMDAVEVTVLEPELKAHAHLTEYLPEGSWLLELNPEEGAQLARQYLSRLERPQSAHSLEEIHGSWSELGVATASGLATGSLGQTVRLQTESVERFSGDVSRVRDELDAFSGEDEVYLVAPTEAEIQRLEEILGETQSTASGRLHYLVGYLKAGFRLTSQGSTFLSTNELFRRGTLRRTARRKLGKVIDSFVDLREGDLVVHLSHGIGRYRGIELLDKQGQVEEHLQIEFAAGAKLYVPAAKIDLVQKYVGGTGRRPTLAKLGGISWQRQKKAAETAVMDMAVEMLELQAARLSRTGTALGPDGEWQREFDASFPYEETDDQLSAIIDIKADMESTRPMDRLLCGDVGFGKTEVAMRAAFKAVDNGFQVVVLVPTTVLAEQHYHTFSERMAEFPFDIARLSRFCSGKEQREIVEALAAGRIEIVVGTHRLASQDVRFHNLGLVIIDEEQRFGVDVKERLKRFKATVDVLTMTATPIPRTLHMSLVGARDISNLETPPDDRVATETRLARFDGELIRHAVLRELNRGGQIFFVHNRVLDIKVLGKKLAQIVPEASIAIAHGQMPEGELEKVMVDFVAHRFDLLLATTIVESGLDIPNANTIFIDEADRYGLADLHQLRGRVGRYKHRAYCYLVIDPLKNVTPNAAKRLRAIEEYSEMGAGFALAMRDLEIRGAGNLLGHQQSGHIATVGYEFYCQLLENAVRTLKKMPRQLSLGVEIDLPGESYLPDDYVPDMRLKIDLYRRMKRADTYDAVRELRDEFQDRFGAPPEPVLRLLELAELRLDAALWQITEVSTEDNYLVLAFADRHRFEQLVKRASRKIRIVDQSHAYVPITDPGPPAETFLVALKSVLRSNGSSR
jgi:transcription-repair coupling factor (superfamily II helicase)